MKDMMTADALFAHYHRSSARLPRDAKHLEGVYVIRRTPDAERRFSAGEILKASETVKRFQVLDQETRKADWVAFAALLDDVILFHSQGDMWAALTCLARQAQEDKQAAAGSTA